MEAVALAIALAMPITPSKTGSYWSPAEALFGNPHCLADVALWFVATNVLIGLLAGAAPVHLFVQKRRSRK